MNALKQSILNAKQASGRAMSKVGLVTGGIVIAMGNALAQTTPTDPGLAAIDTLKSSATSYIAAGFAVLTIVVAGYWGMGMYKKISGKAK